MGFGGTEAAELVVKLNYLNTCIEELANTPGLDPMIRDHIIECVWSLSHEIEVMRKQYES